MEILKGSKEITDKDTNGNKIKKTAIIEFSFPEYVIYVFQGRLSKFDIIVKYKKDGTHIRTPKHIHWVVDVLLKLENDRKLTIKFLKEIQKCWKKCKPLQNNDFKTLKELIKTGLAEFKIEKYESLSNFGEYDVEFLYVLMELLATQEKTNRPDAYMFGKIIEELLECDIDIFKIVSTAGFTGRK